ncbi:MAG: tRNA 2-selenouridine(34) synthase MnmH [Sediminibacterium sp.]
MPITKLAIEAFLQLTQDHPLLDVRSPAEYAHAHIPGAHSLPLFTDEERKIVGTAYKQESREKAIKWGLNFFGPKMVAMVEQVEKLCAGRKDPKENPPAVLVHCWRGGMRSAGVAWLLDLYGFRVFTLAGGYKVYRKWVLQQFEKEYKLTVLGGYTGSDKTGLLHELEKKGETIIDLEALAAHKGSAFGGLDKIPQPSQEMFENLLATELHTKQNASIWLEDESQRIGLINIPVVFFKHMRKQKVFFLDIPFEERLNHIVDGYGKQEKERLVNAIIRIKKRLGGLETKTAISHLIENEVKECFRILLTYYDKGYIKGLNDRENVKELTITIPLPVVDAQNNARQLIDQYKNLNQ